MPNRVILDLTSNSPSQTNPRKKHMIELLKKRRELKECVVYFLCFYGDTIAFVKLLFPGSGESKLDQVGDRNQ